MRLALLAAAALGAVSLLLMLQVLLVTQASTRRQRRRQAFQEQWRPFLAAHGLGLGDPPPAAPANDAERRWWLQSWNQMQATLRGEAHARLNRLLCSLGLDRHAVALLDRHDMRAQLIALACLRQLGDRAHWPVLEPLLRSRNSIKALAAAEALVAIDPTQAMQQLLPIALRRRDWAPNRLAWLCRLAGVEAVTPPLLRLLRHPLSPAQNARLLALVAFADPRELKPWARRLLDRGATTQPAGRVAALGVLRALRDPLDRARLLSASQDPVADVRLAAASALRVQAGAADAMHFLPLLADRTWSVRQEAATALATLPGLAPGALQALAAGVADRYGREALERAIAEPPA